MRHLNWSAVFIAVGSVGLAGLLFLLPTDSGKATGFGLPKGQPQMNLKSLSAGIVVPTPRPKKPVSASFKEAFESSRNYWAFARDALPAAEAGNADAQFYLSRALERCDEDNRMYLQHRGEKLSLDEALRFAVQRHLPFEVAQSVFDRCHEFQADDAGSFGSANGWLAKATGAGQPLGQATTALKILVQQMLHNSEKTSGVANPNMPAGVGDGADPRQLFLAAVRSSDPGVLFSIGEAQNLLNPSDNDTTTMQFAWWLVACQRGLDCSADAIWVKNSCAGDPQCASANGPSDLVRMLAGDQWPDVQERAQEISAKLDDGGWNELNLGTTPAQASNK